MDRIVLSSNAPLEMQQKASRMNACREEIEDLRSRLRAAESLSSSLKDDVAEYIQKLEPETAFAYTPVEASLDRLPAEVLYNIFYRLRFEPNSHLGALVLVNKHIHHFVMTTPSLWARIALYVENDLMKRKLPRRSFIEACIERSQGAGLDVTIDLAWDTAEDLLRQTAIVSLQRLVDEEDQEGVSELVEVIEIDFSCSIYEQRTDAMLELLDAIVGAGGCNMSRWKSLFLRLPTHLSHTVSVLERLVGDTPRLHDLEMQRVKYIDPKIWKGVLPNLSGLHSLKSDEYLSWASSKINPMIKELKICAKDVEFFPLYQALQHLDIFWIIGELPRSQTISLPNLRTLRVEGHVHVLFRHLRTPPLDKLSVASHNTHVESPLPIAAVVQWEFRGAKIKASVIALLSRLFPRLGRTQKLLLSGIPKSGLVDNIKVFKKSNSFSEELQTIVLEQYPDAPDPPILRLGRSDLFEY